MKTILTITIISLWGFTATGFSAEPTTELTIDKAVSIALEKNLDLKLLQSEVTVGQGSELIENGAFDPHIETKISSQEQRMTSLIAGGAEKEIETLWKAAIKKKLQTGTEMELSWENSRANSDSTLTSINPSYNSTVGLTVSQPLLRGNGIEIQTAGIRAAEKLTAAATFQVERQAADLAAQVKKAYWELVFTRQDIKVKQLSLKLAKSLHQETQKKIDSGTLAKVEIYQPESEIARREESLIAAEKNIANTEDHLKLLLNNRDWQLSMVPVDTPKSNAQEPNIQEVLTNALASRPDILAGDLQVEAAEILVSKAENNLKPSLDLIGGAGVNSINRSYNSALDNTFTDSDFSWQLGLNFSVPLGNQTAQGSLAKAKAELAKNKLRAALLRQRTEKNAREAVRDVHLAIKTIEATRKTSLAAQKRLEAEEAKFKVGLATANDVLESQDAYARALAREKMALVELAKAQAELDRVQGIISFRNKGANNA